MEKTTAKRDAGRMISESRAALDEIVRQGAQRMLQEALEAILGPQEAAGLSATNIVRLKESWKEEYESWAKRDLSDRRYVYWWADGIYFNVRLDTERLCLLILMGALEDGTKEPVAVWDGHRESKASWLEVLRDLKARGLSESPQLAVGDGALGFWAALEEERSKTREQRCWVHKTANVLDKLPRSVQPYAKKLIHEMYLSPKKEKALAAYRRFLSEFEAKYPKATDCLRKDEDVLFTFYDFPAEHWMHIRTTNPVESAFATVRHRTRQTKGCGSRRATLMMVFKLAKQAERHWRKLEQLSVARSCDLRRRFYRRGHGKSGLNGDQRDMLRSTPYTIFDNISKLISGFLPN